MKHKWAKEIKAWADGAEIQIRHPKMSKTSEAFDWIDLENNNIFIFLNDEYEFRIKPQPKEPQYINVYGYLGNQNICFRQQIGMPYIGKIKLEVDNDTK